MCQTFEANEAIDGGIIRQLERTLGELRVENNALRTENAQLRARIAELEARGDAPQPTKSAEPPAFVKRNRPKRAEGQPRKKRAKGSARQRATPTAQVKHAVERCTCGCTMQGGSVKRTREVLHIPLVPVQVIEHVFLERRCPQCGKRHIPKAQEVLQGVLGKHRLSTSTMALISALREVGRLPVHTIQWYLQTFHALRLSVGAIVDVLRAVAAQAQGTVTQLVQELQASPVVQGDETTWREDGQNGYMWVFCTPTLRYFVYRKSRSGAIVTETLGPAFDGTLVTDFYTGYNGMQGAHQRCWAHILRDMHDLKEKWPEDASFHTWSAKVQALYERARAYGPQHAQAQPKERLVAQHQFEQELLALCEPDLASDRPQHGLCQRIERFLPELFTFVGDPRVPSDNNAAERAIRPLAVSRKISGGTRSEEGSQTKSILATVFGTWILRCLNPFEACAALLNPP